jgi:hypothetical protein
MTRLGQLLQRLRPINKAEVQERLKTVLQGPVVPLPAIQSLSVPTATVVLPPEYVTFFPALATSTPAAPTSSKEPTPMSFLTCVKSFFTGVANAEHSTVAWLEKELTALENEAPTIARVVDAGIAYVGPLLQLVLQGINEPGLADAVKSVVAKVQLDLNAGSALVTDFGPSPTAASVFASVETNLSSLLTVTGVKNPASVAQVNKAVAEVGLIGQAVSAAYDALTAAATAGANAATAAAQRTA